MGKAIGACNSFHGIHTHYKKRKALGKTAFCPDPYRLYSCFLLFQFQVTSR